jgi:hypothetical protein
LSIYRDNARGAIPEGTFRHAATRDLQPGVAVDATRSSRWRRAIDREARRRAWWPLLRLISAAKTLLSPGMATDVWLLGGTLAAVISAVAAGTSVGDVRRKRRETRAIDAWACAPADLLLAEVRRRAASFATTPAGRRLANPSIATDAELLELLRTLRFQVCRTFQGLEQYDKSGLHAILLALKQRLAQVNRTPARHEGIFR